LEIAMVGAVGLFVAMMGSVAACMARRFPAHVEAVETAAGFLLLGGLTLIGCALPALI
jgi:hypothetical protein